MFELRATSSFSSKVFLVYSVSAWNSVYASGCIHIGNRSASFLQPFSFCVETWLLETTFDGVRCAWILNLFHSFVPLWAGYRGRYIDWIRAGRSGDRIPVGLDFLHLFRRALGPTQPPVHWVQGLCGSKERPSRDADPSPPSSAVVM
jgi:hypothetical protein